MSDTATRAAIVPARVTNAAARAPLVSARVGAVAVRAFLGLARVGCVDGPVGTMYQVRRRIGGGPSEFLATVGEKRFVDKNVPRGSQSIIYEVQAVRSTSVGPMASHNVSWGSDGDRIVPFTTTGRSAA